MNILSCTFDAAPLLGLILVDMLGINKIWGERFFRRVLHHTSIGYCPRKVPMLWKLKGMISEEDLRFLTTETFNDGKGVNTKSKVLSSLFRGQFSNRSTLYWNDFDSSQKRKLESIGNRLKSKLEILAGEKLTLGKSDFRAMILRYEGMDAAFGWHYDTESPFCYRTLTLIKQKGTMPPFVYKDASQNIQRLTFDVNEGIFFKGTRTYHMVESTKDPQTVRWVVGFQFTSRPNYTLPRSFCSEFRGKSLSHVVKSVFPNVALLWIVMLLATWSPWHCPVRVGSLIGVTLGTAAMSKCLVPFLPPFVGTGNAMSFNSFASCLMLGMFTFFRFPATIVAYISYIVLTDSLLPASMVSYHIKHGGTI